MSHSRFTDDNKKLLIETLTKNDYPLRLVNRLINRYHNNINTTSTQSTGNNSTVVHHSLQYIPKVSQRIGKSIESFCDNVRIAYKSTNNVGRFFSKLKDKQPINDSTNVVYRIDCKGCPKCYIGTTGQKLCQRIRQHELDVENNRPKKSALANHSINMGHVFDFPNAKVIERERFYWKRTLLEELHIKASKNCVNIKSVESANVSDIYSNLFKKLPS